jgi:WD40 repeat protein
MPRRSILSRCKPTSSGLRGLWLKWLFLAVHLAWALPSAPLSLHADDLLPQVNSGGHSSKINDLKVSVDGRFVLSVGQDKVVYIWDLEHADRPPKSLRGQSGDGPQGFLHSVAISPVGNLVAVGGWTRPRIDGACDPCEIRLYDTATGDMRALLKDHRAPVQALAFSTDGRWLLSGDDAGHAIYWDVESKRQLYALEGIPGPVRDLAFHPDGQKVIIATADGTVLIIRPGAQAPDLQFQAQSFEEHLFSMVVSSRGVIATAGNGPAVKLWDASTGRLLRSLDHGSAVASLAFDTTGSRLVSAGAAPPYHALVWDVDSGVRVASYQRHDNTVQALAVVPNEDIAVSAGGNRHEIHLWRMSTGETAAPVLRGSGASVDAVAFSESGDFLFWGYKDPCPDYLSCPNADGELQFQMKLPPARGGEGWLPFPEPFKGGMKVKRVITNVRDQSIVHASSTAIADKREAVYDLLQVKKIQKGSAARVISVLKRTEYTGREHLAYSFTTDGARIVSGGRFGVLQLLNPKTGGTEEFLGHTHDISAVAVSPDGRLLATASTDQTIRLWNIRTRELIVSLFHSPENGEWVMWTPQGYFTSSKGGERLIGWQINEGFDKSARFVTAQQIRDRFRRPNLIERAFRVVSAKQAATEAGLSKVTVDDLKKQFLPKFAIVTPLSDSTHTEAGIRVTVRVEPTLDAVAEFSVFVNERLADIRKGFTPVTTTGDGSYQQSFDILLEPGPNRIVVRGANPLGFLDQELTVTANTAISSSIKRRLFLVTVGVNLYPKLPGKDLRFATDDACDFHDLMLSTKGQYYTDIESRFLLNGKGGDNEPTAANVLRAIELFNKATDQFDTAMLFVSGHGVNENGEHYFVTTDATPQADGGRLDPSTLVSWKDLRSGIRRAMGRRVIFVDTCHADGAYNRDLEADSYKERILAFSATDGNTLALELANPNIKNGVFTYAVMNGLRGKGGLAQGTMIKATQLYSHVNEEVIRLTRSAQVPSMSGIVGDPEVSIVIPPMVSLPNHACRVRQSKWQQ